jgi:hypothetical protein
MQNPILIRRINRRPNNFIFIVLLTSTSRAVSLLLLSWLRLRL